MKTLPILFLVFFFVSCSEDQQEKKDVANEVVNETLDDREWFELRERIDGPANVRREPNGEVLFELNDNVFVFVNEAEEGWYKVVIEVDVKEFDLDNQILKEGTTLYDGNDSIGRILQTDEVDLWEAGEGAIAFLYGYTHINNIKPNSIIENRLANQLTTSSRTLEDWKEFIELHHLESGHSDFMHYQHYYNYESMAYDPSPGFRIMLLFEEGSLVGFLHSRKVNTTGVNVHEIGFGYHISFFEDYSTTKQQAFVDYMTEWLQGVD